MAHAAASLSMSTPTAERTALYRVYDGQDTLLYIGISNDFGTRWKQHAKVQPWWGEHRRMTVEWRDSRPEAEAAETAAIKTEHPRFNKMHNRDPHTEPEMTLTDPLPLPAPTPAPFPAPLLVSVNEAAAQLRVGRDRMYELIRRRKVVSVKVGGSRRVTYDSLRAYIDQFIAEQTPAGPESADVT